MNTLKWIRYLRALTRRAKSLKEKSQKIISQKTHLITCIGVDFDSDYIPHFIDYYKKFEISSFHFILQTNIHNIQALEESKAKIISLLPEVNIIFWDGEFYPQAKAEKINSIILKQKQNWHLVVDIDEFVEFQDNSISKTLHGKKSPVFFGKLIDRTSKNGKPKRLEEKVDIFVQFPKTVDYTKAIGGMLYKPILFKDQILSKQLHKTDKYSPLDRYIWKLPLLNIYHFKWTSSTREKLIRRKTEYKKRGYGWYIESVRALDRYFRV